MERFDQPSILLQGPREGTFARVGVELLYEEGRGDPAQPDRAGDAQHLLPPVKNPDVSHLLHEAFLGIRSFLLLAER